MGGWTDGWMDGWMDGYNFIIAHGDSTLSVWRVVTWVGGRMDGWMDGWI